MMTNHIPMTKTRMPAWVLVVLWAFVIGHRSFATDYSAVDEIFSRHCLDCHEA